MLQAAFKQDALNEWGSVVALSYIAAQRTFPDYSDMAEAKAMPKCCYIVELRVWRSSRFRSDVLDDVDDGYYQGLSRVDSVQTDCCACKACGYSIGQALGLAALVAMFMYHGGLGASRVSARPTIGSAHAAS